MIEANDDTMDETEETEPKSEPILLVEVDGVDDSAAYDSQERMFNTNGDLIVRISNDDKENGYGETEGPLDWLNSARIVADRSEDAVHCLVSIGDPRGAFCFTVRRLPDGRIVIHTPHPGEGMAHMETRQLHPGTLEVVR